MVIARDRDEKIRGAERSEENMDGKREKRKVLEPWKEMYELFIVCRRSPKGLGDTVHSRNRG